MNQKIFKIVFLTFLILITGFLFFRFLFAPSMGEMKTTQEEIRKSENILLELKEAKRQEKNLIIQNEYYESWIKSIEKITPTNFDKKEFVLFLQDLSVKSEMNLTALQIFDVKDSKGKSKAKFDLKNFKSIPFTLSCEGLTLQNVNSFLTALNVFRYVLVINKVSITAPPEIATVAAGGKEGEPSKFSIDLEAFVILSPFSK